MGFSSAPLCLGDRARPEWGEDIGKYIHRGASRSSILDNRCRQVPWPRATAMSQKLFYVQFISVGVNTKQSVEADGSAKFISIC